MLYDIVTGDFELSILTHLFLSTSVSTNDGLDDILT